MPGQHLRLDPIDQAHPPAIGAHSTHEQFMGNIPNSNTQKGRNNRGALVAQSVNFSKGIHSNIFSPNEQSPPKIG
jgi:hypothetical protein